jgi:hypothetical protein
MMRYARYAAAVLFALLAVGFVALWVRSYWWQDHVGRWRTSLPTMAVESFWGEIVLSTWHNDSPQNGSSTWVIDAVKANKENLIEFDGVLGFGIMHHSFGMRRWVDVFVPHWFLALSSLGLAALFAFKRTWRYSLRTILVATTILAAILGLAVYVVT